MEFGMKYDRVSIEKQFERKTKLKFLYFWGHQQSKDNSLTTSCLSQWWPSPFQINGLAYPTAEHWMMASKALLFNDHSIHARILTAKSPKEVKALGRLVSGFDETRWATYRYEIVLEGTYNKFNQNKGLASYLLATGKKVIVEASPVDKIWGIGLDQDNPRAENPLLWQGDNLLGFALMEARDYIANQEVPQFTWKHQITK
jgi:ribA/ribD-fused uncharacterized protein